ncbi:MBL fold metallo-hydrolase [Pseudonocardia asaccharolytica]|uniref:MBL fold metallo-hydrolase n=1 Tax=Pseudonocardia asaccharolytica DSM 44247 = NBRC 16224 TaxID=1123024 RepID=A0A511D1S5_9PSEU|nr:MBL fold metallo-hydrolase [Pseudonocardia asaccharolytica]GEL18740.1 MBL fold metallo-hydrolase [Pseudonocardia asaccharolytica DSM 44247 = NBRC 16224]
MSETAAARAGGGVEVTAVVDEGLGNSCYLVDLGDGSALLVDPPRDLRAVRAATEEAGLRIRFAADTHLHADFLSGAAQLAHDDGAVVLASATGRRRFEHRGLAEGDEVDLGGLRLTALATPGHTDEHLSFLLRDGDRSVGVFTGGSLIVGSAARTDLLGADRAEELARAQFASLRRLSALPTETAVWPTHGAGSFCSAPPGAARTSTIGQELTTNPLLGIEDETRFVERLLGSLGSYPPYFLRLAEVNRRGPAVLDPATTGLLAQLRVSAVRELHEAGAVLVDVRPVPDYARTHIPGSLSIPLRAQFATWLGWLVPPDAPIVVVGNPDQDLAELAWQAMNIGVERLVGELAGGIDAWAAAGQPTASTRLVGPGEIDERRRVLDIRQDPEFTTGHLPGAVHIELGALAQAARDLPDEPTVLMCGHGERAMSAASLLERAGHRDLTVLAGGPDDWAQATGEKLQVGS